jgi:small subunit ribosomal protein S17
VPDETKKTEEKKAPLGRRREMIGVVTSDKMQKTVVVEVTRRIRTQKFGKYISRRQHYKAHSEKNDAHVGDTVLLVEARPYSKDKRWRVKELIERAHSGPSVALPDEITQPK